MALSPARRVTAPAGGVPKAELPFVGKQSPGRLLIVSPPSYFLRDPPCIPPHPLRSRPGLSVLALILSPGRSGLSASGLSASHFRAGKDLEHVVQTFFCT